MTPRGKITDTVVPKEMIDALKKAPGAQALGELATEEGFKKMVGGVSFEVPETLDEGTEWSSTAELENPILGKQVITSTYRYLGPDEANPDLEVFAPNIKISFAGSDAAQVAISDEVCEGEMKFNRKEGRLESSNVNQSMTLTITTGGQQIKQGLTQKVKFDYVPQETN
jgi:hypothetical protein